MATRKQKGSPITRTPTVRRYKDVGDVKVWKDTQGKVHHRKVGVRNTTDKGASKANRRRRVKNFINTPDKPGTVQHKK